MLRLRLGAAAVLALLMAGLAGADDKDQAPDKTAPRPQRRPSDLVFVLIEMSDFDDECACEIQHIYDVLRQLDVNHDGKIDPTELKAMRQRLLEERVDRRFKDLDANHDGKISKEESRGRIKEDFDKIDANHDGFIDRDELLKAARERIHSQAKTPAPVDKEERKK
jgi:Ca2+-binding EF-hand superfamily protein